MYPLVRVSLVVSLLLLLGAVYAVPNFDDGLPRNNSTPFLIKEGLDRPYSDELVTYPVTFPANTNPNSLRLYDEDNATFLTFQLASAVYNGGAISSANVSFWVNTLAAGGQRNYTLYHDPGTGFSPPTFPALGVTHTDLAQDLVEISNGTVYLRLWGGNQTYSPPADPATLPGILRGVKGVDNTWRGSGAMVASANVAGHTLSVYEDGPLWRTYLEYLTFPNGQSYQMLFTVFPNRDYVLVHEYGSNTFTWTNATTRANMQVFRLNDFAPDRFLSYGTFAQSITSTTMNTVNTQYYLAGLPSGPVWGNGGWGGVYATDAAKNDVIGVVPVRTGTWNGAGS
ncbi:MAG TPA: hypothetical protein VGM23_04265, partial [Armatimonadota bacterium]